MKLIRWLSPLLAVIALAGCGGTSHTASTSTHTSSTQSKVVQQAAALLAQNYQGTQPVIAGGRYHAAGFGHPLLSITSSGHLKNTGPTLAGYDSVDAAAVPFGAAVASCYVTGSAFANCPAVEARHPQHVLTVAVLPWIVARCLDTEPSDATPQQAGPWVHLMIYQHGITHPCIYADGAWMPAAMQSAEANGVPHCTPQTATSTKPCFLTHLAAWDNNPAIPAPYDGIQWKSTPSLDYDTYYTYFFAKSKPPKPKLTGTANFGAAFSRDWIWGIHGQKGSVKGSSGYPHGIAAEVQVGQSHHFRIKGMSATAPPIRGKAIRVWWPLNHVLFPFGVHFTFQKGTWAVWGSKGTIPKLPKGCDRLSAQIYMATHGSHSFKPEIRKMACDSGPLFGAK